MNNPKRMNKALDAIHATPGITYRRLASTIGVPYNSIRAIVRELIQDGHEINKIPLDGGFPVSKYNPYLLY